MPLPNLQSFSRRPLKYLAYLLIVTLVTFSIGTSFAQEPPTDEPWAVYLYNDTEISQFNADGTVASYNLPTENSLFSSMIAVSPDESRVATCTLSPSTDPSVPASATLRVYDLVAQNSVFELPLGEAWACEVTRDAFSLDGTQIAVGIISAWPTAPGTPQPEITWRLHLIDTVTREIISTLDSLSAQSGLVGDGPRAGIDMPYVRRVDEGQVIFALVYWFTHGLPSYNAYIWDTGSNSVMAAPQWGHIYGGDEILTADGFEFAYTRLDEGQPAAVSSGPVSPMNTVVVQREGGEPQVVYRNTRELITGVRYINGGNALAISLLEGVDPEAEIEYPVEQKVRWIMLTRDGTVTEIVAPFTGGPVEVMPIRDGYIVFTWIYGVENVTPTLNAVTSEGTMNLWTYGPNSPGYSLLYATPPDLSNISLSEFVLSSDS
jgi:hypothetical protein